MFNHVNKVNIAASQNKTEVMIQLVQEAPQFGSLKPGPTEGGTLHPEIQTNCVADIMMTAEFARELARLILSVTDE